ncbi:hypothetical protein [Bradyrhizobium sp. SZCCHNPS1003]|uniref:hypothetical protein n=1 Tax=unclassified Bradyrhizobium TaxID=2631580 RepID=UPI0028E944B5|nr:hypothetical protein [Bradyrhizobium sp. SZCCHNPS1003]
MSWCDKLASTPTVGFALTPHFAFGGIVDALSPIMDRMVDRFRNPTFTVNDSQNSALSFTTEDGFTYAVDPARVTVSFQHRLRAKPVSAGLPVMDMVSKPLPYTEMLPSISERLIEAARLLPRVEERKILQVGIVSTTSVSMEDLPPGINSLVEHLARPWAGSLVNFNVAINSELGQSDNWIDRCQHTLAKVEDPNQLMTLIFDFHRQFKKPQSTAEPAMKTLLNRCTEDALKYFEELAEGNMFDEHLISDTNKL